MGYLPTDIQRLAIPAFNDARESGASLRPEFDDAADPIRTAARAKLEAEQRLDYDYSMADDTREGTGRRTTGSGASRKQQQLAVEGQKKHRELTEMQMLLIALHDELEQIEVRRTEINAMRDGIEDVFTNGYEVGSDGQITNEQAEKALREYETRTGQTIDRGDETAVLAALQDQWEAFEREEARMNKRAAEIEHIIEQDIPATKVALNSPTATVEEKLEASQTLKVAVGNSSFDGMGIIRDSQLMDGTGYKGERSAAVEGMTADANAFMEGMK